MVDVDKILKEKIDQNTIEETENIENGNNEEKENNKGALITKEKEKELSNSIKTPNFKPQLDTSKDLQDQAGDVIAVLGAQRASENEAFMDEVSENFQKGVLTDQETKNMQKQRLLEQEYFLKWQDVLQFAFIKSPHGLLFMKIMTIIAMIVYVPLRIAGMAVKAIGTLGEFLNDIFNSVFGGKGKYLRDKNGEVIIDPTTKKPYKEKEGYNLFAKLLFGLIIVGLGLGLIFLFIELFTGFSVFSWFRTLIGV